MAEGTPEKNPLEEEGEVDLTASKPDMAWRENPFGSMRDKLRQAEQLQAEAAAELREDAEWVDGGADEEEPEVDFGDMYGDAEADVHRSILEGITEEEASVAAAAAEPTEAAETTAAPPEPETAPTPEPEPEPEPAQASAPTPSPEPTLAPAPTLAPEPAPGLPAPPTPGFEAPSIAPPTPGLEASTADVDAATPEPEQRPPQRSLQVTPPSGKLGGEDDGTPVASGGGGGRAAEDDGPAPMLGALDESFGMSSSRDSFLNSRDTIEGESFRASLQDEFEGVAVRHQYSSVFPGRTLGLQIAEYAPGQHGATEDDHRHVVTNVQEFGPAQVAGVLQGSIIQSINGHNACEMEHHTLLAYLKKQPRPLTLVLENAEQVPDNLSCALHVNKTRSYECPAKLKYFKEYFVILGGALAKPNTLQFFKSEEEYAKLVETMRASNGGKVTSPTKLKAIATMTTKVKAYKLDSTFRVGPLSVKKFDSMQGTKVVWFWLKNPKSRSKVVKMAGTDPQATVGLYRQICLKIGPKAHSKLK